MNGSPQSLNPPTHHRHPISYLETFKCSKDTSNCPCYRQDNEEVTHIRWHPHTHTCTFFIQPRQSLTLARAACEVALKRRTFWRGGGGLMGVSRDGAQNGNRRTLSSGSSPQTPQDCVCMCVCVCVCVCVCSVKASVVSIRWYVLSSVGLVGVGVSNQGSLQVHTHTPSPPAVTSDSP